jgi:hypothetical protein
MRELWRAILYLRCVVLHWTVQNGTEGIICRTCGREWRANQ